MNTVGAIRCRSKRSEDSGGIRRARKFAFIYVIVFGSHVSVAREKFHVIEVTKTDSFGIINSGPTPILNPRLIPKSGLDLIDFNRWLSGIYLSLPQAKRNRESLFLEVWKFLGSNIYDFCSPGRKGVDPRDPLPLISGYGYGCCSNTNPVLEKVAKHLGFDTRIISTTRHQFLEIKLRNGWQIVDANRGVR